jgi:hypothetical protein
MTGPLEYAALVIMIIVFVTLVYAIIAIHDIPYEIAKSRGNPHQDAIHTAGWVSLFTLHVIWPFLWIWATAYHPDRGYGFSEDEVGAARERIQVLEERVRRLEARIAPEESH